MNGGRHGVHLRESRVRVTGQTHVRNSAKRPFRSSLSAAILSAPAMISDAASALLPEDAWICAILLTSVSGFENPLVAAKTKSSHDVLVLPLD